uniref:Agouti-signaling protein n=1 Tax=Pundamilia nyererei TaxID=303518 RepID=A0A3B4FYG5_9CICH
NLLAKMLFLSCILLCTQGAEMYPVWFSVGSQDAVLFSCLRSLSTCFKNMIFYVITSSSLSLLFFQNKYGVKKRPPPPANCISLSGSCKSQGTVCCDYCAFCQCRLFRTVCYCRMGNPRC